jgi:two-component system, OmpR family, sensor histidine kinase QseC
LISFWNPAPRRSLVSIILLRLAMASVIALILQIAIVTLTSRDEDEIARTYIYWETRTLAEGLTRTDSGFAFQLPNKSAYYTDNGHGSYAFRIVDEMGGVIAQGNALLLESVSPWTAGAKPRPDVWASSLNRAWLHVAGGERLQIHDQDVFVEVATLGDPANARWRSVAHEIFEDVLSPMLPLMLLLLIVATASIRWSLQPLIIAAQKAERITEIDLRERFDLAGMPQEAASFALAINRLLERIGALVESQKIFIARAAHELRTPLAIMLLELGKISDERARRLEVDVSSMSEAVNRLLTLAKLKALPEPQRVKIDLVALTEDVVGRMRHWAVDHHHELNLVTPDVSCEVMADFPSLREALRNLIENAVKHTPPGTKVDVTLTPDLDLIVEDDGPAVADVDCEDWFEPFRKGSSTIEGTGLGLAIVKQAMELHGGSVEVTRSQSGGTRFRMRLQTSPRIPPANTPTRRSKTEEQA